MSFAQTSSAEGIPTPLQNGYASLHIVDAVAGTVITNTAFAQTKVLALAPPIGRYHLMGSIDLTCAVPLGNWIAVRLLVDGNNIQEYGLIVPPAGDAVIPISCAVSIGAATTMSIAVASQAGTVQYTAADLVLIRL